MGSFSSKSSKVTTSATTTTTTSTKPPVATISDIDRAVLDLKNSRDKLQKYHIKLDKDNIVLLQKVKDAKNNNRTSTAINLLKLYHYKKRQLSNVEEQLLNIYQLITTIDSTTNHNNVIIAMKNGKNALQVLHNETSIESIIQLYDTINEQNQYEQEISTVINDTIQSNTTDLLQLSDDELELELLSLMNNNTTTTTSNEVTTPFVASQQQQDDNDITTQLPQLPQVPDTPLLPQVPTQTPVLQTAVTTTTTEEAPERVLVPAS